MKVVFLGSSHGVPEPNRRCQSIMVEAGEKVYIIDMGTQSIETLITKGVPVEKVEGIFITHMHGDHSNGLVSFIDLCNWRFTKANPRVYIPGCADKVKETIRNWLDCNNSGMRDFEFITVQEGLFYDDGNVKLTAYRTRHVEYSYAYLLEAEGKRVLFSGDFCSDGPAVDFPMEALEKPLDLAICECAHFDANEYMKVFEGNNNLKKLCINHYSNHFISSVMELGKKLTIPFRLSSDGLEINL